MRAAIVAILLSLVAASSAEAARWTRPQTFDAGTAEGAEPAPRVAIAADGRGVLAWSQASGRLVASFGDRGGRFGAAVRIARGRRDFAVAAGRGGAAAIAYEASDGLHVAVRSGRGLRDRRVATSTGSEINGVTIAADPLGGWVVAERQFPRRGSGVPYRVRALSLDAGGRRVGEVQDLGLGSFGLDGRPTSALTVLPDGRALLVFEREAAQGFERQPVVLTSRPHGGTFAEPVVLAPGHALTDARVTVADGEATIGATEPTACGDTGCAGLPRALRLAPDGTPGPLLGPVLANPNRSFAPWAAGASLVFQLKTRVQPFTREAPVRAVSLSGDGALQTLTREKATEPVALALPGGRVLALWATRSSFGAALAGPDGRFRTTAAPVGPPPAPYHLNPTNRDARAAGRYVLVAWARGATVRVSLRR